MGICGFAKEIGSLAVICVFTLPTAPGTAIGTTGVQYVANKQVKLCN